MGQVRKNYICIIFAQGHGQVNVLLKPGGTQTCNILLTSIARPSEALQRRIQDLEKRGHVVYV